MPFCIADQAICRGRYKQQMGIVIDSVTQAFYMHEEQRLVFWCIWKVNILSSCSKPGQELNHVCNYLHTGCVTVFLFFISDPVCLSVWVTKVGEVWSGHMTPPHSLWTAALSCWSVKMPLISLFTVSEEPGCGHTIWHCRHSLNTGRSYAATHRPAWHIQTYKQRWSIGLCRRLTDNSHSWKK